MKMVNVVVIQRWFVKSNYLKQKQLRIRINFSKSIVSQKIKCSHILVAKQSEALAILDRIKNGEKFGKLAKELSTDTGSAKRDGNLGYFTRGKMVKAFEEVAFKLQVGQISEPVKSEFGYHVIKRLG
jgi:foldase protein PrsA